MLKSCWHEITINDSDFIDKFKKQGKIEYDFDTNSNIGVIINKSLIAVYDAKERVIRKLTNDSLSDMKPANKGLSLFYDMLLDPNITVICVNASAGTGKTSTSIAYANQKVIREQGAQYQNITITRPNVETGKGHGFLPGTLDEKLDPLNAAFTQWIERMNQVSTEDLKAKGLLVNQPIAYIRGIDIQNSIFIVDECQNLTKHEMKTILTRVGENSKVILLGDSSENQIDNKHLNSENNGLVHVISKWQGKYEWFGYVELTECLRGPVCKAAIQDL